MVKYNKAKILKALNLNFIHMTDPFKHLNLIETSLYDDAILVRYMVLIP